MLEENNKNIFVRSLCKSRNSISVNIPKQLAKMLGITPNSVLVLEGDQDNDRIILKKIYLEDL